MLKLLKKEILLSMHPVNPIFLALSAMVMIPNYPYSVIFFYTGLSIFFTCMQGRENKDVIYSVMLPVRKKDIVSARIGYAVILEMLQMLLAIPFAILSQKVNINGNEAGMMANMIFFAIGFLMYGIFNFIFFTGYYKNTDKVGIHFVIATIVMFLIIIFEVISTYAIPFVKDKLDTKDSFFFGTKLVILILTFLIYAVLTFLAVKKSERLFEELDLHP